MRKGGGGLLSISKSYKDSHNFVNQNLKKELKL